MNQENPHIHLENVDTIIFRKNHLLSDQISPEPTGIRKQPAARLQSLQEAKILILRNYNPRRKKEEEFIIKVKPKHERKPI
jgi:hypothetical protein